MDLTTFSSVTDKEELYQKIFMHALTIDSIGFESNGKKANRYHGLQDVENKVLRLTSPGVSVSEGLMKRILTYVADGFTVEKGLREKIEQEQYFRRPGLMSPELSTSFQIWNTEKRSLLLPKRIPTIRTIRR